VARASGESGRDYYGLLQVDPRADTEVIEAAYRRLARKWHPDANPDPEAAERMRALNEAYAVLGDPARRQAYDAERVGRAAGHPPLPLGTLALVAVAGVAGVAVGTRLFAVLGRGGLVLAGLAVLGLWIVRRSRR
jgi:preprotein translocase subunit Sec63